MSVATAGAPRAPSRSSATAAGFAILVIATFGAFFVAQRLKNSPTVVQQFSRSPIVSPNSDGRFDAATIRFKLRHADVVDVEMVDSSGDRVATLADDRRLRAYTPTQFRWSARRPDGRPEPDGSYRARITLRHEGRSITVPKPIRVDTTPPKPRILGIGPQRSKPGVPAPELLPEPAMDGQPEGGTPATVRFTAPGRKPKVRIYRTTDGTPVGVLRSHGLRDGATTFAWDGRISGRLARAGTYLVVVSSQDEAGNVGSSAPLDRRTRRPVLSRFGQRLAGPGGITIRPLGVVAPSRPSRPGEPVDVFVDARGASWTWTLRRVGGPKRPIKRSGAPGSRPRLRFRAPGAAGVYLLSVRTAAEEQRVPIVVGDPDAGRRVLVVLPWATWQGRNPVDDDGDGRPDTLDAGLGVRVERPFAGDGLPLGFATHEAPVLGFLDRTHRRYDVTTDVALLDRGAPALSAYRGVLLPGDTRWLPPAVAAKLRGFARAGGTVVSLGTQSLRRGVTATAHGRLVRPTAPAARDLFDAVEGPVVRGVDTTLTIFRDDIDLFAGGEGSFSGVHAYEPTASVGGGRKAVATAVTPDGRGVIVAARVGRGLVIRPGLPDLGVRLTPDAATATLMNRLWVLMAQGPR